jgi:hypothetical protein
MPAAALRKLRRFFMASLLQLLVVLRQRGDQMDLQTSELGDRAIAIGFLHF